MVSRRVALVTGADHLGADIARQVRAIAELQRTQATDGLVIDRGAIVYLAERP
ncbi:MAG: hypothetical protein QOH50_1680 [Kribbellaceae bacterium]|jgi:hypothetical protein|nr:hypothetical protein [Kribbellaceae bacterium]